MKDNKDEQGGAGSNLETATEAQHGGAGGGYGRSEQQGVGNVGGQSSQYATERAGAATGAAVSQQVTAKDRAFYSLGATLGELINDGIAKMSETGSPLKYPHGEGREWIVLAFDAERGLKLQEPNKPTNTAWVAFDETAMRGVLPKILTF